MVGVLNRRCVKSLKMVGLDFKHMIFPAGREPPWCCSLFSHAGPVPHVGALVAMVVDVVVVLPHVVGL